MPWKVLYFFSDFIYVLMAKVFRYRSEVISSNLLRAFPEKTPEERQLIKLGYYSHFADLLVEWIKMIGCKPREIQHRVICRNNHVISKYLAEGRNLCIVGGHMNNWEWFALAAPLYIPVKVAAVYKPLSNAFWEKTMQRIRNAAGTTMVPMKSVLRYQIENNKQQRAMIYATDQSPSDMNTIYWCDFFSTPTAVMAGSERMARRFGDAMVFGYLLKLSRGHYELIWSDSVDAALPSEDGSLTAWHTHQLEAAIRRQPECWLWSHRRWKHSPAEHQKTQ